MEIAPNISMSHFFFKHEVLHIMRGTVYGSMTVQSLSRVVVDVVDSNIQRVVLATEETTVARKPRSWSQRRTKANGSHHSDNPLLKPTGI